MVYLEEVIEFLEGKDVVDVNLSTVKSDLSLEDNGFDSLDVMMVIFEVSEEFSVNLDNITKNNCFDDILEIINKK